MSAKHSSCLGVVALCLLLSSALCLSETVFVAERNQGGITVFDVTNDTLSYLETIDYGHDHSVYGLGPIDLAADEKHDTLFVSFETYNSFGDWIADSKILLVNTRTLEVIDTVDVSRADDIGGLCFDPANSILYGIERNSNIVYEIEWEPSEQHLLFRRVIELPNMDWACAIQIHGDSAYVSEYYYGISMKYHKHIKEYNIADNWSYVRTISMGAEMTCLAYDSQCDIFYGGAYNYSGTYQHLAKHEMDPNDMYVKDIETCVIDADVEEDSGYVFVTTYRDGAWPDPNGTLEIWDTSGWTHDPNQVMAPVDSISEHIAGPAGVLCLASSAKNNDIIVTKTDGLNGASVVPSDTFTYTITVDPNGVDHDWVTVIDYLPPGVSYDNVDWSNWPPVRDLRFSDSAYAYTWELGPLDATDDPVELTIEVTVNNAAEPLGQLVNFVTAESDVSYDQCYFQTPVGGTLGGNMIYVDDSAPAGGNGTSWQRAYRHLSSGLDRAELMNDTSDDIEIWVAGGTYRPGVEATDAFEIPEQVDLFGGYAGYGAADPNQRNFDHYPSVLSGYIGIDRDGQTQRCNTVVKMGNNSMLNGVTVTESGVRGIDGSNVTSESTFKSSIENCTVTGNLQLGIDCENANLKVKWSEVLSNGHQGIYHSGEGCSLKIENSKIFINERDGIHVDGSEPNIINSVIHQNGLSGNVINPYYGINLVDPSVQPILRNNTIVYNTGSGIKYTNSSNCPPPQVKNCILFYNDAQGGFNDLEGVASTWHCSLTDPNDLETPKTNPTPDDCGNICTNPGFAYLDPALGNFHLAYTSPCVNKGDPNETEPEELDIDGQMRQNGMIDIGADEKHVCNNDANDIFCSADLNADGVVNLGDYNLFSRAWLSHDPNDPTITTDPNFINEPNYVDLEVWQRWRQTWNPLCDLDESDAINLADLESFWDDWLWVACWRVDFQNLLLRQSAAAASMTAVPMITSGEMTSMSLETDETTVLSAEKSLAEQAADLENTLILLETLWKNDPLLRDQIDHKSWKQFILSIESSLEEMEASYVLE